MSLPGQLLVLLVLIVTLLVGDVTAIARSVEFFSEKGGCSCDRTAPAHFNAINRAMAHVSDRQAAPACSQTVYMVSAALMVVGSAMGTPDVRGASLIASRTPPASKSRAAAKIFR